MHVDHGSHIVCLCNMGMLMRCPLVYDGVIGNNAIPALVPRHCDIVHKLTSDISHFMSIINVLLQ